MTHKERLREQNLSLLRYLKWVITLSKVGYREEGDQLFMGTQWKDKGPQKFWKEDLPGVPSKLDFSVIVCL